MKQLVSAALAATLVVGAALAGGTAAGAFVEWPITAQCSQGFAPMFPPVSEDTIRVTATASPAAVSPGGQATITSRLDTPQLTEQLAYHFEQVEITWDLPAEVASVDEVSFPGATGWTSEVVELVDQPGGHLTVRHTGGPATGSEQLGNLATIPATTVDLTVATSIYTLHQVAWPAFSELSVQTWSILGSVTQVCTPVDGTGAFHPGINVVPQRPFTDVPLGNPFVEPITVLSRAGVVEGPGDGSFRPLGVVTRQAMSAFVYRLAGEPAFELPEEPTFSDVPATNPFYEAVEWFAAAGISDGYPDGTYGALEPMSRQHMAVFLYRLAGLPPYWVGPTPEFLDVPATNPFQVAIEWLAAEGITTGYPDGTFQPQGTTTRQVMAAFLHRFSSRYPDIPVPIGQ